MGTRRINFMRYWFTINLYIIIISTPRPVAINFQSTKPTITDLRTSFFFANDQALYH